MKTNTSSCSRFLRVACVCTAATATILSLASCRVKQTQEAKAPEVEVKEGQMPKYDVDAAKVTVQPEQKTITVPDVDVTMPDESASPAATVAPTP